MRFRSAFCAGALLLTTLAQAELVVDDTGKGRGNMAEAVNVSLTPDGVFQVEAPRKTRIDLENVQRKR